MTSPISSFTNATDTTIPSATNFIISGSGISSIQTIDSTYSYIYFSSGTLTLNIMKDITVDLLLVGGGGGGGKFGGGGGAGQVLYTTNFNLPNGTHSITIGNGGSGAVDLNDNGNNGNNTSITINAITYTALGGGGGGTRNDSGGYYGRGGNNGGSGGGGSHSDFSSAINVGGSSTKNIYSNWTSLGNAGGEGKDITTGGYGSGGGGGAGSVGANAGTNSGGNGGSGINLTSIFGTIVGHSGWFGGGGGGGSYSGTSGTAGFGNGGSGLFGGGGNGTINGSGVNGLANTGGGGGGADLYGGQIGGTGGSGVVIIKFKTIENITEFNRIKELKFTTSGTVIFNTSTICDVLLVGGGGGGGSAGANEGGGGGGGGSVGVGKILFKEGITYTITVGNGGPADIAGNNSSIVGDIINEVAYGGGNGSSTTGGNGGSGGGGGGYIGAHYGGNSTMGLSSSTDTTSIIYYGNQGGYSAWTGGGAGGGGAMNKGTDSEANNGQSGGSGYLWPLNNTYYGDGGGGGGGYGNAGGNATGGGGKGGNSYGGIGNAGSANTGGGGGGGASSWSSGGAGGSGIVIIRYSIVSVNYSRTCTVYLSELRNNLGLTGEYSISSFRSKSINLNNSEIYLASYLISKKTRGLTTLNPGKNALDIKNNSGVTTDGNYYIMCNTTPTLIYCLMDNKYDGGGWMMIMKATTSSTFNYEANYWTTANTLNSTDLTRNNADAKYESFNSTPIKDVLGIWPLADFGYTGGSFTVTDGWVWLVNNWYNNGGYVKAIDGFQRPRDANPSNPYSFAGMKTGVFSTQSPAYRHVFGGHSHIGNNNWGTVRWGFVWNENGGSDFNSCDAWNGIGVSRAFGAFANTGKSAGDNYGCCGSVGYNRAMRIELYGR